MRFDPDWSGRCSASQTFGTSRRARTRRLVRLYGFEVMNRIRRMPSSSFTRSSSAARSVGGVRSRPYALTVCPSSVTSRTPARASSRISARIAAGAWLRSRPRVTGTTQNVQCLSQPSMTVTKAFGAGRPGRLVTLTSGASPTSSTGRPSRRARSTSSPTRAMAGEPKTRSTIGARCWIAPPRSWAMQPITPIRSEGFSRFSARSSPSLEKTFSSAFSRMAHVFSRIRSASAGESVSS